MKKRVAVIGGINMDIGGSPARPLVLRDSNPGRVSLRPGGVGRNIAHNLCLLGLEVSLITVLGTDVYGEALLKSCEALGLDMSMALRMPGERSSVYLYVTDAGGDMLLGLSDMELMDRLTPERLSPLLDRINRADAAVLDGNLPEASIRCLAESCRVPLYADPVSTAKAEKLKGVLGRFRALKPNALEAEVLSGEKDPNRAAAAILAAGAERVFISLGAGGLLAGEGDRLLRLPCLDTRVVNTNGAGDAATAALVWAGVQGLDLARSARAALLAGAAVAGSPETNTPLIRAALRAAEE